MAITRPFAYNTGSEIPGTTQLGNLAIGVDDLDYSLQPGGVRWWNGPDESLGYIIAHETPSGNQPNPLGVEAFLGFWRSEFTDESFIGLSEYVSQVHGSPQTFLSGSDAKTWLNNNGYWTSWSESPLPTPTNTPTPTLSSLPVTPTPTSSTLPVTPTPTSGYISGGWLFYYPEGPITSGPPTNDGNTVFLINPGFIGTYNPNYTGGTLELYFNENDSNGNSYLTQFQQLDTNGGSLTISQGSNTAIYSGVSSQYNLVLPDGFLILQVSNVSQLIQSATTAFVSGTSITITVNANPGPTPTMTPTLTSSSLPPTPTPTLTMTPTPTETQPEPTPTPTLTMTPTPSSTPPPPASIVGAAAFNKLIYSDDGLVWSASTNGNTLISSSNGGTAVATNGSIFVGGGGSTSLNRLVYSIDGRTWSASTSGNDIMTTSVNGITYSDGLFMAVGIGGGGSRVAMSNNGIDWTATTTPNVFGNNALSSVSSNGNGRWVVGCQAGGIVTQTLFYSDNNGETFTQTSNGSTILSTRVRGIVWGGDRFVAVGNGTSTKIAVSFDGITWSASTNGNTIISSEVYGVTHNGTTFVAVGSGTNKVAYSNDGFTWTASTNANSLILLAYTVIWDGGKWIVGSQGDNTIIVSSDLSDWSSTTNGNTVANNRVSSLTTYLPPSVNGGEWNFYYTTEGDLTAEPPTNSGEVIFAISGTPLQQTFNPNYTGGTLSLLFNVNDSNENNYLSQFQTLDISGGTLTISQNENTAVYNGSELDFYIGENDDWVELRIMDGGQIVQQSPTSFVYGQPITLTIS